MTVDELLEAFRGICDDEAEPYFWSDTLFYTYLTDAIVQYCRYGRGIRDHTSSLTTIEYTAESPWANLDEKIIKVISAFDEGNDNRPLAIVDWETFMNETQFHDSSDYGMLSGTKSYPDKLGTLNTLIIGLEDSKLRLVNIPTLGGTLKLVIERYPIYPINENNQKIEGVPTHDRFDLLEWVKHRAYLHEDAETFDPDMAETSRQLFMLKMKQVDSDDMVKTKKKGHARYGGL